MTPNRGRSKEDEPTEVDGSWPINPTQQSFIERSIDRGTEIEDIANRRFDRTLRRTGAQMRDTLFMGKYRIAEPIGKGGMGSVYEAYDIAEHRCAVKLMHSDASEDPNVVRRFLQEAKAAAIIKHQNVIEVLDHGIADDGRPYLVMPYLDGQPLGKLLKERKQIPITESLGIFLQICDGLAEAHARGVIHRDIKPSNIMFLYGGNLDHFVKIVDFGIAKVFPQAGDASMKQTTTGELFGSPHYMSPEQCKGQPVDQRSDIYALGCLMYEVVTGKLMFTAPDYASVMFMQVHNIPPPLVCVENQDSGLVARMEAIIHKCVAKESANRYQSMSELAADLRSAIKYSTGIHRYLSQLAKVWRRFRSSAEKWLTGWKLTASVSVALVLCVAALMTPLMVFKAPQGEERAIPFQMATSELVNNSVLFKEKEGALLAAVNDVVKAAPVSFRAMRKLRQFGDFYRISGRYSLAIDQYKHADQTAKALGLSSSSTIDWSKASLSNQSDWADIATKLNLIPSAELATELDEMHFRETPLKHIAEELANIYGGLAYCCLQENDPTDAARAGSYGLLILSQAALDYAPQALNIRLTLGPAYDKMQYKNADEKMKNTKAAAGQFNWCLANYQLPLKAGSTAPSTVKQVSNNAKHLDDYAICVSTMADFAQEHGYDAATHQLLAKSHELWAGLKEVGYFNAAVSANRLGLIALEAHDHAAAARYFQEAVDTFAKTGNDLAKAKAEFNLADALWADHKFLAAISARFDARKMLQRSSQK